MLEDIKSEEFTVLKGASLELEANGQHHNAAGDRGTPL